jgi:hypothetical protein
MHPNSEDIKQNSSLLPVGGYNLILITTIINAKVADFLLSPFNGCLSPPHSQSFTSQERQKELRRNASITQQPFKRVIEIMCSCAQAVLLPTGNKAENISNQIIN